MRAAPDILINGRDVELWPAALLRARSSRDARLLARSRWLLRRKRDGVFLAAINASRITPLLPDLERAADFDDALAALATRDAARGPMQRPATTAPDLRHCADLGIDAGYGDRHALTPVGEPDWLVLAGFDRYRRPLWLLDAAAAAWRRLSREAWQGGVLLDAVSGYRSACYQRGIIERKLARGQTLAQILSVNTAPGYSEHHSGRALDISCAGEPAAELGFDRTPAFDWLRRNAGRFGFVMSYPSDNPHGVIYEPWHWCWHPPAAAAAR